MVRERASNAAEMVGIEHPCAGILSKRNKKTMLKPIKKEILRALDEYQQRVADILTKQGVKAHIVGDLKAYKKLAPITIDFGSVQKGAKEFGVKYGDLLRKEGATMIHGKKVAWLADSLKETRAEVSNIINEGVRTGKGTDAIARELRKTLIRDKNFEYKRIARTETGNIQAHAADKRYKEEGVEEVDWLCGQKPCSTCAQYCGKRYKINEAPALLVHPNCTCDKAPVVTRRVREKIDKKEEAIEKPLKKKPKVPKKKLIKKEVLEQMKKEERSTANKLWKKTSKDGNEHMITRNGGIKEWHGDKTGVKYTPPKEAFTAQHTHPWDAPLSGDDLANFLKDSYCKRQTASSSKRIYSALRTMDTPIPKESKDIIIKKFEKMSHEINLKATKAFKEKTGWNPVQHQAKKIWKGALDETNKIFAKEYKYDYITFGTK